MELIGLSDRILVFSRGRIVNEVAGAAATEEESSAAQLTLAPRRSASAP